MEDSVVLDLKILRITDIPTHIL
jgi:hypothetical protein